jgi:hypothetical protein
LLIGLIAVLNQAPPPIAPKEVIHYYPMVVNSDRSTRPVWVFEGPECNGKIGIVNPGKSNLDGDVKWPQSFMFFWYSGVLNVRTLPGSDDVVEQYPIEIYKNGNHCRRDTELNHIYTITSRQNK